MRREERVTVQGPVKEQQPDGMSHRGRGGAIEGGGEGGGGTKGGPHAPIPGPLALLSGPSRCTSLRPSIDQRGTEQPPFSSWGLSSVGGRSHISLSSGARTFSGLRLGPSPAKRGPLSFDSALLLRALSVVLGAVSRPMSLSIGQ